MTLDIMSVFFVLLLSSIHQDYHVVSFLWVKFSGFWSKNFTFFAIKTMQKRGFENLNVFLIGKVVLFRTEKSFSHFEDFSKLETFLKDMSTVNNRY